MRVLVTGHDGYIGSVMVGVALTLGLGVAALIAQSGMLAALTTCSRRIT